MPDWLGPHHDHRTEQEGNGRTRGESLEKAGFGKRAAGLGESTLPKHAPLLRVRARVGTKWATILIDTGCTGVAIGREFAERLGRDEVFAREEASRTRIRQGD